MMVTSVFSSDCEDLTIQSALTGESGERRGEADLSTLSALSNIIDSVDSVSDEDCQSLMETLSQGCLLDPTMFVCARVR